MNDIIHKVTTDAFDTRATCHRLYIRKVATECHLKLKANQGQQNLDRHRQKSKKIVITVEKLQNGKIVARILET